MDKMLGLILLQDLSCHRFLVLFYCNIFLFSLVVDIIKNEIAIKSSKQGILLCKCCRGKMNSAKVNLNLHFCHHLYM